MTHQQYMAHLMDELREEAFGGDPVHTLNAMFELATWTVCIWLCSRRNCALCDGLGRACEAHS